jgi:ABC-type multidrug transport system fused ATPase/permease subunit
MLRIIKKFGLILSKKQKRKVVFIIFMMLIGALLETMSVSLVVPLVTALMQDDFMDTNRIVNLICGALHIQTSRSFILLVITALIIVFIVKDLFLYLEYYIQTKFTCNNRVTTQKRLMEVYLNRPYEFFLNASSGEIMRVIKSDTAGTFTLLTTVMSFFTEAIVAVMLIIAIVIVDYQMALMIACLLACVMLIIYKVVKPVLRAAGHEYQYNNAVSNKWILQAIEGVKEMKVANKGSFFVEEYSRCAGKAVEAEKKYSVLGNVPRLIIEAVVISGMLGYIGIMVYFGKNIADLLPQISAFAVAAVRLLPCANRMSTAMNSIAYNEPQLDKTIENLRVAESFAEEDRKKEELELVQKPNITLQKECGLYQIDYAYPNTENNVLDQADLVIPVGKSVGIIGTSGAGKTTAVDILLGLLQPANGKILSDGTDIRSNYEGWLKHLAYIPQTIYMLDDTIRANVAFGFHKDEIKDDQVWSALEEAQMGEFVRALPDGIYTSIGERGVRLSGGQRQRIGIARALYTDPELLIFDEATSALDNETEMAIMESINSLYGKKTMVIIAHRLTTIQDCDLVYRVEDGKIQLTNN